MHLLDPPFCDIDIFIDFITIIDVGSYTRSMLFINFTIFFVDCELHPCFKINLGGVINV